MNLAKFNNPTGIKTMKAWKINIEYTIIGGDDTVQFFKTTLRERSVTKALDVAVGYLKSTVKGADITSARIELQ